MTVIDLAEVLDGAVVVPAGDTPREARGGYASDLLSDVMANAQDGDVWITMQRHVNTVAVAQLKNLTAIVIVNGRQPEGDMAARAAEYGVAVVTTPLPAFDAPLRALSAVAVGGYRRPDDAHGLGRGQDCIEMRIGVARVGHVDRAHELVLEIGIGGGLDVLDLEGQLDRLIPLGRAARQSTEASEAAR